MGLLEITVNAEWDTEGNVWVATSEDVPGLITEADTLEDLQKKLTVMIPELLQANGLLADSNITEIPLNLVAHREQLISLRG
jgi:predicted RNase H-like HicB family nuclease